jgi:CRP-like cAMP-binding protein
MFDNPEIMPYIAQEERYPAGGVIIREGEKGFWVYIVLQGTVKIVKKTDSGAVTLSRLGEGQIFGEMMFFMRDKFQRTTSVVADGPVVVGLLDTELITADLNRVSGRLQQVLTMMISRLKDSTDKTVELISKGGARPDRTATLH